MLILQYKFEKCTEKELELIPVYNDWLCDTIFSKIDTKVNRRKIDLRLNYVLEKVNWIDWKKDKYNLTTSEIIEAIYRSIIWQRKKNNIYNIIIDTNICIPHSYTSIEKYIRFLNYGDTKQKGTGIFELLINDFSSKSLNSMWQILLYRYHVGVTNSNIITK